MSHRVIGQNPHPSEGDVYRTCRVDKAYHTDLDNDPTNVPHYGMGIHIWYNGPGGRVTHNGFWDHETKLQLLEAFNVRKPSDLAGSDVMAVIGSCLTGIVAPSKPKGYRK